jgi:hypothetical protein
MIHALSPKQLLKEALILSSPARPADLPSRLLLSLFAIFQQRLRQIGLRKASSALQQLKKLPAAEFVQKVKPAAMVVLV